jgi:vanillate O-demethylase monooxygenase subunit
MLYRKENGDPIAMLDRCPHRFVPLSLGTLRGDEIACAYHGLRFDSAGICTHNPHGATIPKAARVDTYPVVDRHGATWIWFGDAEAADPALIPDYSPFASPGRYAAVHGYTHMKANYELITDNLLDLSHVAYLHPDLRPTRIAGTFHGELVQDGQTLCNKALVRGGYPNNLFKIFWPEEPSDFRSNMRWDAPSVLYLDVGITGIGQPEADGVALPSAHLLTPETETTTHYFWAVARNVKLDDAELGARMGEIIMRAFTNEDAPVIAAQQANMGTCDLMSLKPVLLETDGAALRARRILARMIADEQGGVERLKTSA